MVRPLRRVRSAAVALAGAVVLAGAVAPAARADDAPPVPVEQTGGPHERPDERSAPDPERVTAPVDPYPGLEQVSAIVRTGEGIEIVTEQVLPAEVGAVVRRLEGLPGAVAVGVDAGFSAAEDGGWVGGWDPLRDQQWGNDLLHLDALPADTPDGSGVIVAVLDTGVMAEHEDLAGRVRCDLGGDFALDSDVHDPADDGCVDPHGHGTHVAGTVGAIAGNMVGTAGVSQAQIMPVRVLRADGWAYSSNIAAGIYHAVDSGASVLNMSIYSDGDDDGDATRDLLLEEAVQYAVDHDVVVVAAAGNHRLSGNGLHFPSATPGAFAVAALHPVGVTARFSYQGPTNLITAPGVDILSTTYDGAWDHKNGTSMAAPHVAGVLARYRELHPEASVAEIRQAVQDTALDLEQPGLDESTGYGLINAYELLTGEQPPFPLPDTTAPASPVLAGSTAGNRSLTVNWTAPHWDGGTPVTGYRVGLNEYTGGEWWWRGYVDVPVTARTATLPGLTHGSGYSVTVVAVNEVGEGVPSGWSATVRPYTTAGAPVIGAPTPAAGSATVRWSAPASDGGSPVTGYTVRAWRGTTLVKTVAAAAAARSALVTGLVNGTPYTFTVTAANAAGAGPASARSAAATPRTTPGAPKLGTPTAGRGAATITWTAPAVTGGSPVTGYVVKVWRGTTLVKTVTVTAAARSALVGGLRAGVAHTFTVTAKNVAGLGTPSARSRSVTPRR